MRDRPFINDVAVFGKKGKTIIFHIFGMARVRYLIFTYVCSRNIPFMKIKILNKKCTVKPGNKERFDKEQIGCKEPFPVTNLPFTS